MGSRTEFSPRYVAAERQVAWVRLVVTIAGTAYFAAFADDPRFAPLPAILPLLGIAWAYAAFVLVGKPYLRLSRSQFVYSTAAVDALITTYWVAVTGAWESNWWPMYVVMIAAIAYRFDYRETMIAALVFAGLYLGMLTVLSELAFYADPEAVLLRMLFIFLTALLAGPLARHATEQARERHSFEEAARRAQEIESIKSRFFANVSHELRTPLSLILGPASELAGAGNLSAAQRDQLRVVLENARSLLRRVGELLEVARLETGRLELRYTEVDLGELVRLSAGHFDGLAGERRLEYDVRAPERLGAQVDSDRIARVMVNLIGNAFKFAPGPGRIRVELRSSGDTATLEVADSGPGIPRDQRETVFERFRRLEDAGRRYGGTGLGLAIARELVELHGGRIEVDDAPEGGALFRMVIPRSAPHGTPIAEEPPQVTAAADEAAALAAELHPLIDSAPEPAVPRRPRVLVVEDNAELNRFLRRTLGDRYDVATAYDGITGWERARELEPDLILTDLMMPGMSGEELLRRVRSDPRISGTPVVVLTALDESDTRQRLLEEGANDYVTKPFSPAEVKARIAGLVAIQQAKSILQRELDVQARDLAAMAQEVALRNRELRTAVDSVNVAREHAERAAAARTSLLRAASHELRSPLQGLALQLERLRVETSAAAAQPIVGRMSDTVARLGDLLDALLEYARAESGRLSVAFESFDPTATAAEVVDELRPQVGQQQVKLSVAAGADLPPLQSDRRLVRLILVNLVGNAIKFTRRGSVTVRIEYGEGAHRISVEDTGPGIRPEERARIFAPFERLEPADRARPGGYGLGLALVDEMTRALGGRIELRSEPGAGSTFTVVLPERAAPPAQARAEGMS